jgi:glucan 1,3-beta-glucosidase
LFQWKLRRFYREAYARLVKVARPGTRIVFHDAFSPRLLSGVISAKPHFPVVMDTHWYEFTDILYKWHSLESYFKKIRRRPKLITRLQKCQDVIVGEWSVVLSGRILDGRQREQELAAFKEHGRLQLEVYGKTAGWFYWTYKTEGRGIWHFRSLVEDGIVTLD